MTDTRLSAPHLRQPSWGGVLAMSLAAFVLVASEFMPVSLLTPIATDFQVSEGQAGLSISVSGLFALLTSLVIASVAARVERKRLLLCLTLLMIASATVTAFAPNYALFMAGRALIGIVIWYGWDYAQRGGVQSMAGLESVSMFWAYLAMPVGGVFCAVGIIGNLIDPLRMELETAQ